MTSLTLNLGRAAGSVACFDISIVPDTVVDAGESFSVVIDSASPDGVAFRDTTTVSIIGVPSLRACVCMQPQPSTGLQPRAEACQLG